MGDDSISTQVTSFISPYLSFLFFSGETQKSKNSKVETRKAK
uniref:Uncharacterized protein n=1 Tax=Nelumbo nucifera TaxID=4432 RepID=A0A822YXB5_NELNU|nr:TPA_asm: hypothetical protein HUJ06_007828 [Nelumbo nucifera]